MSCTEGMRACRTSCLHRQMVDEYRDWRHSWEQRREDTHHYQLENDEYAAMYPPPTFRAWLEARAGTWTEPHP